MTEERQNEIQLDRYKAIIGRRKGLIITFCLTAALTSFGLTYVMSERYQAIATVLYQPKETVSFQAKAKDALGFPLPLVPLETIANTLEDIVKGDVILEKTVRTLRLDVKIPPPLDESPTMEFIRNAKDWVQDIRRQTIEILKYGRLIPDNPMRNAMEGLGQNVVVRRTNKAYTFRLEVRDQYPARAAKIAETLANLLSDYLVEEQVKTARESRTNIDGRLLKTSAEVRELRNKLRDLKFSTGISSLDEEIDLKLKTINSFEEDRSKLDHEFRSLQDRRAAVSGQLAGESGSVKYDSTEADNPVFNDLRMEQARLQVERSGLLEKFTPEHNDVRAVEAKLTEVEEKLKAERPKMVSSETTRINDLHQKLESDLLSVSADMNATRARMGAIQTSIDSESRQLQNLLENQPDVEQIVLQLAAAEKSYQLINEAYQEALLAESKTVREVSLQGSVLVPIAPVQPIKFIHVGTTLLLSLALAIGFSLFGNYFDFRIYDAEDAEQGLDVPVLGTIPAVRRSAAFTSFATSAKR